MSKSLKNCLLASFLVIILISCSGISAIAGYSIGKYQQDETGQTTTEQGKTTTEITEKSVYYEQTTSQRYFDENSPADVYQKLISDSANHFTFEFAVQDQTQFLSDKDFILANLENQYSRLSVKLDTEISNKITVKLTDDLEAFQSDLNTLLVGEGITTYSAFALGTDLIEVYLSPVYIVEKFELAHALSHELVHVFHYQINDTVSAYSTTWAYADWFIEGMAEGFSYPNEEAIIHGDAYQIIPDTSALNDLITSNDSAEYMVGYDAVELFFLYLANAYGEDKMIQIAKCKTNFDSCFATATGLSPDAAYATWLQTL